MSAGILTAGFFARPTLEVARELIGTEWHVRGGAGECSGRIVEVEAYLGEDDPASHAGRGPTPRSAIMFGPPGGIYVYLIYGMHHCLNLVTEVEGRAGAVLIRAIEPLAGSNLMAGRRGIAPGPRQYPRLCSGPGKLCRACGIDLDWNGSLLASGPEKEGSDRMIWLTSAPARQIQVETTPRIGLRKAVDRPYRFIDPASSSLSR